MLKLCVCDEVVDLRFATCFIDVWNNAVDWLVGLVYGLLADLEFYFVL